MAETCRRLGQSIIKDRLAVAEFNFAQTNPANPFKFCTMRAYRFIVHDNGAEGEKLGVMGLSNDAEALDFGKHIIQDLFEYGGADDYVGCTVDITEGTRAVSSLPIE